MRLAAIGLAIAMSGCAAGPPLEPPAPRRLTVAAVSMESRIRDPQGNLQRIEQWSRRAARAGADLVLFPETALSGWWRSRQIQAYAEPLEGPAVRRLIALAGELDTVLAVGMTERAGERIHITHVVLDGRGIIGTHRKTFLAPGEEMAWDPGDDANVFDVKGVRVGIAICYESVQPTMRARLKRNGAELILAPYANGTDPGELLDGRRRYPAQRARENRVWYVACDAPARDGQKLRRGAAYVIDPAGQVVAITPPDARGENMIIHTIDFDSPVPHTQTAAADRR